MKKNLRAAIIGFGSIGKRHLINLSKFILEKNIIIFTSKKITNHNLNYTNNIKDLINFKPNFIIISNAATQHLDYAKKIMNNSTRLLIEKPLSDNSKKVTNFIKFWKKKKPSIKIGYNLRYLDSLIYFRKLIKNKNLGKILYVNIDACSDLKNWRKNTHYSKTVSAQKKLGGGVLLEMSHELDYLRWIFGDPDYIYSKTKKLSNLKINVEDTASIILDYKKKNMIINVFMNFFQKIKSRSCMVVGSKKIIKWDLFKNNIFIYNEKNKKWILKKIKKNNMSNTYVKEIEDLIFSKKNNKNTYKDLIFNLNTLKLIETIKSSSKNNKKILFNKKI